MRILITGSSGQIGTNLGLYLLRHGHEVWGLDRRSNPWTTTIPTLHCDLGHSPTEIVPILRNHNLDRLDAIVHLAAHAKVFGMLKTPEQALENVVMTHNVLQACLQLETPVVFSSSREVYGSIQRPDAPIAESESDLTLAQSPYSASKIACETWIYSYARCYGIRYLVFRLSNVYGRYDHDLDRLERVVPLFIRELAAGRQITVYGEQKLLDFTHVDDCVRGLARGIERLVGGQICNHTINLAYGDGHTLTELAHHIGNAVGRSPQIVIKPSRAGEIHYYVADISKARVLLEFRPTIPLSEGILRAVSESPIVCASLQLHTSV